MNKTILTWSQKEYMMSLAIGVGPLSSTKQRLGSNINGTIAHYCTHLCYLLAVQPWLLMPGILFISINYKQNNSHLRPERVYDELGLSVGVGPLSSTKQRLGWNANGTMAHYCTHLCYLPAVQPLLLMPGILYILINYKQNNSHLRPERVYDELGHWSGSIPLER